MTCFLYKMIWVLAFIIGFGLGVLSRYLPKTWTPGIRFQERKDREGTGYYGEIY